jgi:hypothetical protein
MAAATSECDPARVTACSSERQSLLRESSGAESSGSGDHDLQQQEAAAAASPWRARAWLLIFTFACCAAGVGLVAAFAPGLTLQQLLQRQASSGIRPTEQHIYVAAEAVSWTWAPSGLDACTGLPFDQQAQKYVTGRARPLGGCCAPAVGAGWLL